MLKILEILDPTSLDQQSLIQPKDTVPEGATVVGRLPDHLQKLKSFVTGLKRQADRLDLDIKHCDDDEQRAGLCKELEEIVGKGELLIKIFWWEARQAFNLRGAKTIGLAHDWQLWVADECQCPQHQLMRELGLIPTHCSNETSAEEPTPTATNN